MNRIIAKLIPLFVCLSAGCASAAFDIAEERDPSALGARRDAERLDIFETGASDSGKVSTDAESDTGSVALDTGIVVVDTGVVMIDTGTVVTDTGTVVTDTGTVVTDTGVDTGTTVEAGGPKYTIVFPLASDSRSIQYDPNFGRGGDKIWGSRSTSLASAISITGKLFIAENNLAKSCAETPFEVTLSLNGVAVGVLPITYYSGSSVSVALTFPRVYGPIYNVKLETFTGTGGGCGSLIFANGVSGLELGS